MTETARTAGTQGSDKPLSVGVDLGGTKTAVSVMDEDRQVLEETVFPTNPDAGVPDWTERTAKAARELALRHGRIVTVGVGAAGQVRADGTLVATANVGGWREVNLGAGVGQALGVPGTTDNDAKVELLAELDRGAARGARTVLLVAVGTGVGGAFAQDGVISRGAQGFAGEIGHTPVHGGERLCGCGSTGHLETFASGTGIFRSGAERAKLHPDGLLARTMATEAGAHGVFAAAEAGDGDARAVLAEAGFILGEAIATFVTMIAADLVVLAGGVAFADGGYWEAARDAFDRKVHRTLIGTEWKRATLGDAAGTIGAGLVGWKLVEVQTART